MAFPTIPTVADGRVLTAVQANTTSPRTFPDLSSLTKNSGDLLIAIIVGYQSSLTSAIFSSWGAGFTEIRDIGVASQHCVGVAYKISDGTESGTFTVAQAGTITGHAAMILLSIPGAHSTTAPEVSAALATGTSAAANPAALDPAGWGAEDTLWIAVAGSGETSTTGSWTDIASAPTNYSDFAKSAQSADAVGGVAAAVAFRQLNASSEDVGAFTVDTSNARNCAFVIAVRPSPAATQVTPSPVTIPLVVVDPVVTAGRVVAPDPVAVLLDVPAPQVTAGRLVSPTPVTIPLVIPAPTITAEVAGASVTPDPVAITLVVPVPAVTAGRIVSPSPVPVLLQIPTPVVTAGRIVSPASVPVVLSIPTPAVTAGRLVSPAPVQIVLAVPDPVVSSGGSALVTPAPVPIQLTIPVHTVTAGRLVSPTPVAAQLVIPAPVVTAGRLVSPSPVQIGLEVPVPAVIAGRVVTPDPVVAFLLVPVPVVTAEGLVPDFVYVLPLSAEMVDALGVTGAMIELPRSSGTMTELAVTAGMEELP